MPGGMSGRAGIAAVITAVVVVLMGAIVLSATGDDGVTTTPPAGASPGSSTTPGRPVEAPAVTVIPATVTGYMVRPVAPGSYRLSLVWRLRNTILNGVDGPASDYAIQTATARRAGRTALLFGVAAVPGASPPDVPADVIRLIGIPPSGRDRVGGVPVTLFRAPGYTLAVVDGGPRRAVVAIAARPAEARALGHAIARSLD